MRGREAAQTHSYSHYVSADRVKKSWCFVILLGGEGHSGNTKGRYHGGRRPSSDDSFHSPTVIPPSALDKPSIMKRYHRRRTCSHTSPRRSPTVVTLHDTRYVECRWWNDGWTVKTVITGRSSASMIPVPDILLKTPTPVFDTSVQNNAQKAFYLGRSGFGGYCSFWSRVQVGGPTVIALLCTARAARAGSSLS